MIPVPWKRSKARLPKPRTKKIKKREITFVQQARKHCILYIVVLLENDEEDDTNTILKYTNII